MMAYGDGGENLALLKRTISGIGDFSGRSRRTEVVYYWIATALIGAVARFAVSTALPWNDALAAGLILQICLSIPVFALFARRLHDQNRSAWWALILPVMLGLGIYQSVRFMALDPETNFSRSDPSLGAVTWIGLSLALAYVVLSLLPGTRGENPYGRDPREGG